MITHDTKIRVWYKHTDQMGFVHHSNYICYYEEARSDLMRSMGLSYADMERKGIIMPILEVQSVYKRPASTTALRCASCCAKCLRRASVSNTRSTTRRANCSTRA